MQMVQFQFLNGAIKILSFQEQVKNFYQFQFLNGAIKIYRQAFLFLFLTHFNSLMVRLKYTGKGNYIHGQFISIP